jgi:hypothetical protein
LFFSLLSSILKNSRLISSNILFSSLVGFLLVCFSSLFSCFTPPDIILLHPKHTSEISNKEAQYELLEK